MRYLSPCLSARKKEGPLEPLFFWGGRAISHHYMQDYKLNLLLQNMVFLTSAFSFCFPRNVHIKLILTQSSFLLPSRFSDLPTALRSVYQAFAKEGQVYGQHQPRIYYRLKQQSLLSFMLFDRHEPIPLVTRILVPGKIRVT